jgi:predicted transcriptional regulator
MLEYPDRFPDKAVVFLWLDAELSSIFTKERMRLLRKVKTKAYNSVSQLAADLKRDVSMVSKDVKVLEKYGLIRLERQGNRVKIFSDTKGIYIPLEKARSLEEYVEKISV